MMELNNSTFGIKQIIGLVFVIAISALIIYFADELNRFSHYGYFGAFFAMFLSYASVILPTPGLAFLFALGGTLPNTLLIGLLGGLGGTLGECVGYAAGLTGSGLVTHTRVYKKIEKYILDYGILALFVLSVIPNPLFDLAGISAGALGVKWWRFMIAVGAGTTVKALAVAYMGSFVI